MKNIQHHIGIVMYGKPNYVLSDTLPSSIHNTVFDAVYRTVQRHTALATDRMSNLNILGNSFDDASINSVINLL